MQHHILALPSRWRLAALCGLYAAVMLYSSTLIGPAGPNFVYRDPAQAFLAFLHTRYVPHGSDQRADWVGNLLMLVPFGFMVAAALWPARPALRILSAMGAVLLCALTILAIKYAQLFFPPRTVTLNYIMAQTLGAVIGCIACSVWHQRVGHRMHRRDLVGAFVLGLRLYTGALCLFILMPLDFALNATDLYAQFDRLPETVLLLPGHDRSPAVRMVVILVSGVAFIPVGMLLTFVRKGVYQVRRGILTVAGLGFLLTTALYALSMLVISAFPAMPSILYRTAGIIAGAAAIRWLGRQDADRLRQSLARLAPWATLPYLFGVLLVNGLLSTNWLTWSEAVAHAYPLGLLPLFDYYIVSKAEAAKNIVGHAVLYMPVGVLLWLRLGNAAAGRAVTAAALLSSAVELARYLRPGLEGDINAVVVAGLASLLAVRLMPAVWSMVQALGRQPALPTLRPWRARRIPAIAQPPIAQPPIAQPLGEVEHF
jgi:glycopeptide antibiotics resistance protein